MRIRLSGLAMASGLAMLSLSAVQAGTLIPVVPVAGNTGMNVLGINDSNVIVGGYLDANGVEHGYFGTLDGNYTTFDYTANAADGTEARAINNDGFIAGFAPAKSQGLAVGYEFVRKPNGDIVTILNPDGRPMDGIAQGITAGAKSVGDYFNSDYTLRLGYLAVKGKYKKDLTLPFDTTRTQPRSINSSGDVVGFFGLFPNYHGFLLRGGVATQIDYPDRRVTSTGFQGINDNGLAAGGWSDKKGNNHPFLLDTNTNTFTPFDVNGATSVAIWGINTAGFIAVDTDIGLFIYCPMKQRKCPGNGQQMSLGKPITVPATKTMLYNVK